MLKLTKMPEFPKTFVVEFEGAKFYFRVPHNLDKFDLITAGKTSERIKATFATIEKVDNIVDSEDKPISPDNLLELLSLEQITKIIAARNAELEKLQKQFEAETKNS